MGFDYYKHGYQTGAMAARILKGEKPADIPVEFQKDLQLEINAKYAALMGVNPACRAAAEGHQGPPVTRGTGMTLYAALGAIEQGFVYGIMVIGVYLTFRILDFPDLTVDGSLPLGASISAVAITSGVNPYLSLLLALAGGFLAGVVTAVLNTKFKILHLLASILTMIALYSINIRIMSGPNVALLGIETVFDSVTRFGVPGPSTPA